MKHLLGAAALVAVVGVLADTHYSGTAAAQYPASTGVVITAASTTTVKATAGTLRRILVTTLVLSSTVKLYDVAGASCTGTPGSGAKGVITQSSTITSTNPYYLEFQQSFANGICVVTSGATNVTIIYD